MKPADFPNDPRMSQGLQPGFPGASGLMLADQGMPADDEGLDLHEYWRIVMRHKWRIIGLAIVVSLLALLVAAGQQPVYKASSMVMLEPAKTRGTSAEELAGYYSYYSMMQFVPTQIEIMESRTVAEKTAPKLEWDDYPLLDADNQVGWTFDWRQWLPEAWRIPDEPAEEEAADKITAGLITGGLSVRQTPESQLVEVSFESTDPQFAADAVNTVVKTYIENDLEARLEETRESTGWLTERLADLRAKLKQSEAELQAFREEQQLLNVQGGVQTLSANQLDIVSERLLEARQERVAAENLNEQASQLSGRSLEELSTIPSVLQHPLVASLAEKVTSAEVEYSELSKTYGRKHPKMVAVRTELGAARTNMYRQIEQVIAGIEKDYEIALRNENELRSQYEDIKKEMQGINRVEYELGVLEREVETNRQLFETFLAKFKQADTTESFQRPVARVVDAAMVPTAPFKPNKRRMVILSFVLALMGGVALAILLEKMDRTFASNEDVEDKLSLPVLGALPALKIKSRDQKASKVQFAREPKSIFSEEIRTVRTGVVLSSLDREHNVVVVTSSVLGEGKSTVAMNLAMSLAGMEKKTLVIDGDMRRPSLADVLDLDRDAPGLSNLVAGTHPFDECVYTVPDAGLQVMPSGLVPPNPLELLSSQRFASMIEQLRDRYDRVVIDSAPVQSVSDALVLSKIATQIIYVVKANDTPYTVAQEGVKRLRQIDAPLIGVVLNQVSAKKGGYYYGRYGYYQQKAYS
jgi:capsular exopolysaccharide synthesis family protein